MGDIGERTRRVEVVPVEAPVLPARPEQTPVPAPGREPADQPAPAR